jgi:3-oxo-4-pregnene-20-carboxyl-CoA dehydrogenase alpha subunit
VNIDLSDDALTFGALVHKALESAGGDELLPLAERDPGARRRVVEPALGELGAWDLSPRTDPDELEAAAALCRAVGAWAAPYPAAERLARPDGLAADGLVVVAPSSPRARVAGLDRRWVAVSLDGRRSTVTDAPLAGSPRATAFVADLTLEPLDDDGEADLALGLVLPGWTVLGMLDRALALTRAYVQEREQFGQPLAGFQGVQFQLTDAEVERVGAEELGKYALWSVQKAQPSAVADALAFRLAVLEAADVVFRVGHQLHGAIGFCDETVLSWISRASAPLRRLPLGVAGTTAALTGRLGRVALPGLFGPSATTT